MNQQFWRKVLVFGVMSACAGISWGQTDLAEAPTLAKLRRVRQVKLPSLKQRVERIEFSRDGQIAALQSYGDLVIFDAKTWRPLHTFKANLAPTLNQFALSPDGKTVALVHYKQSLNWSLRTGISLEVRNVRTGQLRFSLYRSDLDNHVIFSPDGKRLFTLSDTADWRHKNVAKTLGCWNVATGRLLWHQTTSQPKSASTFDPFYDEPWYGNIAHSSGLSLSADGKTLATEVNGLVELRAADSGTKRLTISAPKGVQAPLIFSADGKLLATSADIASYGWNIGDDDTTPYHTTPVYGLKIWDTQTGKLRAIPQIKQNGQYSGYIYTPIAFWPNSRELLTLSYSPTGPVIFDARTGVELGQNETDFLSTPLGAAISPDGQFLIMATEENDKIGLDYYARQ